jgi:hypothetical protein
LLLRTGAEAFAAAIERAAVDSEKACSVHLKIAVVPLDTGFSNVMLLIGRLFRPRFARLMVVW